MNVTDWLVAAALMTCPRGNLQTLCARPVAASCWQVGLVVCVQLLLV